MTDKPICKNCKHVNQYSWDGFSIAGPQHWTCEASRQEAAYVTGEPIRYGYAQKCVDKNKRGDCPDFEPREVT
jgi:hypothetical protein